MLNIAWGYNLGDGYAHVTTNASPFVDDLPIDVFSTERVTQIRDAATGKSSTHAVEQAEWLDPELTDKADVQHLMESLPEPTLTPRIVTTRVNSTGQQGPELMNQLRGGSAGKMTPSGRP